MTKRILVIGGGVGGLATAIAARRVGIDVDLVEIRTDWKVYHVGIIVQGNFIRALERIGLADDAVAAGFPLEGVVFQDLHDHELHAIPGVKLASPQYPSDLGMSRPALHGVLTRGAAASGARVRTGTTFTSLDTSGPKPRVTFTDGTDRKSVV